MGTGNLFDARLGVLQFQKAGKALKYMVKNEKDSIGEVRAASGALCAAMAATIGTGNMSGSGYGIDHTEVQALCFG